MCFFLIFLPIILDLNFDLISQMLQNVTPCNFLSFDLISQMIIFSLLQLNFLHRFHSLIFPQIMIQIEQFFILWIRLQVFFLNIVKSLISHLNLSSDLIKFQEHPKNFLISLWIQPLFTIILTNY